MAQSNQESPRSKTKSSPAPQSVEESESLVKENEPQLPEWTCIIENSPQDSEWTVGEVIEMECQGPRAQLSSGQMDFIHPEPDQKYRLKILGFESDSENQLQLKVTSYNPGAHELNDLKIAMDGRPIIKVEPLTLPVKTVIQSEEVKPYGPVMAVKLGYPYWLWGVLALIVLSALFYFIFRYRRNLQMKRVVEELQQHNTALGAFNQFNKDIRKLGRDYIFGELTDWSPQKKQRYVESLDEIFRMYLLREFFVPALDWDSSLVLKTLARQDKKRFAQYGSDLAVMLQEFDQAKRDADKLQSKDCRQLNQMAKKVSHSIWKARLVQR
jgi:hypothetical protein